MCGCRPRSNPRGATLPEILIVLTIAGTLAGVTLSGFRGFRDTYALRSAMWSVRNHLVLARTLALGRRETIRVRISAARDLELLDSAGTSLAAASVGRSGDLAVDSMRIRPSILRFNSRGQAAPGSVYLYRGDRIARVVSNFLGRVRTESYRSR